MGNSGAGSFSAGFIETLLPLLEEKRKQKRETDTATAKRQQEVSDAALKREQELADQKSKFARDKELAEFTQGLKPVDPEKQAQRFVLEKILGSPDVVAPPVVQTGFEDENVMGRAQGLAQQSAQFERANSKAAQLSQAGLLGAQSTLGTDLGNALGDKLGPLFNAAGLTTSETQQPAQVQQPVQSQAALGQMVQTDPLAEDAGSFDEGESKGVKVLADGTFEVTELDPITGKPKKIKLKDLSKLEQEVLQRRFETQEAFQSAMSQLEGLSAQFQTKLMAQGGKGGFVPGILGLTADFFSTEASAPIGAFEGQRSESALALNSVLTGQNRVIKGVVAMILGTFPDQLDGDKRGAQKMAQSIRNAFKLMMAKNKGMVNDELIQKLGGMVDKESILDDEGKYINEKLLSDAKTKRSAEMAQEFVHGISLSEEEEAVIDALVDHVLNIPPAPLEKGFGKGLDKDLQSVQAEPIRGKDIMVRVQRADGSIVRVKIDDVDDFLAEDEGNSVVPRGGR